MSSFICSACGTLIIDSPTGYLTGCEHYPVKGYLIPSPPKDVEVFEIPEEDPEIKKVKVWFMGAKEG